LDSSNDRKENFKSGNEELDIGLEYGRGMSTVYQKYG
jgi:hypothetical protein